MKISKISTVAMLLANTIGMDAPVHGGVEGADTNANSNLGRTAAAARPAPARTAQDCARLRSLRIKNTRIETAELITDGTFTPPTAPGRPTQTTITGLPALCRVAGLIEDHIGFEVWLPLNDWNNVYHGVGIGGFAGAITYSGQQDSLPGLAEAVRRGFAASATDTGHKSDRNESWSIGRLDLVKDMLLDGTHKTAVVSKQVVATFYQTKPQLSSFAGCSGGGHQALTEATRFPDDYDAIVAFAPAAMQLSTAGVLHASIASHFDPAAILSPAQVALTWNEALKHCDGNDGLVDGSLTDPRRCNFKPADLQCKPGRTADCLTGPQVKGLEAYYLPFLNSNGGTQFEAPAADFRPGAPRGNGASLRLHAGPEPTFGVSFAKVFEQNPNWDWHTFTPAMAQEWLNKYAKWGETSDFRAFRARGGKLILMQGWADWGVVPEQTVALYKKYLAAELGRPVNDSTPADASSFMRLITAPDTDHCGGGSGANQFDVLSAVIKWRETGTAPTSVIASRTSVTSGVIDRTRPICPYPQEAVYNGSGDIDEAGNFTCRVRKQGDDVR